MFRIGSIVAAGLMLAAMGAAPAAAQSVGQCGPRLGGTPHPGPYNVYFEFGKSALDAKETDEVHRRAKQAKDIYVTRICLIGFADKVGDANSNKQLGLARARHVASVMMADGVPAANIVMDTGGEAYGGTSFGSYDKNRADRRVMIVFNR